MLFRAWAFALSLLPLSFGSIVPLQRREISNELFEDFTHYWKYCSASPLSAEECPYPNGQERIFTIDEKITDTQAFVVRDDSRKEIVVVFAATRTVTDILVDLLFVPVPWPIAPPGSLVHLGFVTAYNAVADQIIEAVTKEVKKYPGYGIVSVGHSLGAATTSIMGVTLSQTFPDNAFRLYTYGHPRTFNTIAAKWVDGLLGNNSYRVTHTNDPVPLVPPLTLGYKHQGTEYWQSIDPAEPVNFKKCKRVPGKEDDSFCYPNLSQY